MITDLAEWKEDYFPKNLFSSHAVIYLKRQQKYISKYSKDSKYIIQVPLFEMLTGHTHLTKNQRVQSLKNLRSKTLQ